MDGTEATSIAVMFALIIGILTTILMITVWRMSHQQSRYIFLAIQISIITLLFGFVMDMESSSLEAKLFWNNLEYFGHIFVPTLVFVFSMAYTQSRFSSPKFMVPVVSAAALLWLLVVTNSLHHLHYESVALAADPVRSFEAVHGPAYFAYVAFVFSMMVLSALVLYKNYKKVGPAYKGRMLLLELAVLFPLITMVLVFPLWEYIPAEILIILGILISSLLLYLGTFGFEMFRMLPFSFDSTVQTLKDGVLIADEFDQILYLNPAMNGVLGVPHSSAIVGKSLKDVLPLLPVDDIKAQGRKTYHEYAQQELLPQRFFDVQVSSIHDRSGKSLSRLFIIKDVTERLRMEAEIRESRERYIQFFQVSPNPIVIFDLKSGHLTESNQAFETLIGRDHDDIVGRSTQEIGLWVSKEDEDEFLDMVSKEGWLTYFETQLRRRDGSIIDALISTEAIDFNGEKHCLTSVLDITARKRMEAEQRRRLDIISAIAAISSRLIALPPEKIPGVVQDGLTSMGELFAVDRAYLFQISDDGSAMSNTFEWCAPGITPQIRNLHDIPCETMPWWMSNILAHEVINIPRVADMPSEADVEREALEAQDIRSLIVSPLTWGGKVQGFIGLDAVRDERSWNEVEIKILETFSYVFAQAFEKKIADETIIENEEKFRALFNSAGDSIFILSLIGEIIEVNKVGCARLQRTREELLGRNVVEIVSPETAALIPTAIPALIRDGSIYSEITGIAKDGTPLMAEASIRLIQYERHQAILVINRNITERKAAEKALRFERDRLDITLNNITDGVMMVDGALQILVWNRTAERMLGLSHEAIKGRKLTDLFPGEGTETSGALHAVSKAIATQSPFTNYRQVLPDRESIDLLLNESAAPIIDKGRTMGAILVLHDITAEKRLESEQEKVERLKSLGTLAGGIAHDFNNILTILIGQHEVLFNDGLTKDAIRSRLKDCAAVLERAKGLSDKLLTFSQGGSPVKRAAHISQELENIVREMVLPATFAWDLRLPPDLKDVDLDPRQIRQAMFNILKNAEEAMPRGGTVHVAATNCHLDSADEFLPSGNFVHIVIRDEGQGISEANLAHIFEPFFSTKHGRAGMSLAATYSIVKQHNGLIKVESKLGAGTSVHVYLPVSQGQRPSAEASGEDRPLGAKPRRARVLIMDDEDMILEVASEMLGMLGHEAFRAHDGEEAVDMYMKAQRMGAPYDAVIMDLIIPEGMGGKDAIALLLKNDPQATAIVSSGYSNDPVMSNYRAYGFAEVMPKPYSLKEMEGAVDRALRARPRKNT